MRNTLKNYVQLKQPIWDCLCMPDGLIVCVRGLIIKQETVSQGYLPLVTPIAGDLLLITAIEHFTNVTTYMDFMYVYLIVKYSKLQNTMALEQVCIATYPDYNWVRIELFIINTKL